MGFVFSNPRRISGSGTDAVLVRSSRTVPVVVHCPEIPPVSGLAMGYLDVARPRAAIFMALGVTMGYQFLLGAIKVDRHKILARGRR